MKLVFALLSLGVFAGSVIMAGTHLTSLLQPVSFLLVFCGTLFLSLSHHSATDLMGAFRAALGTEPLSDSQAAQHAAVLSTPRITAAATGAAGFIIGMIGVLSNLSDPSRLGPAIAVAFLAILYALILSEFIMAPLINRLHTRSEKTQPSPAKANHISGILVVLGTLGTLVMLMAVMVSIGVPG